MQTRTVRLATLPIQGFLVYLFCANILAQIGVVNLPLSYGAIDAQGFGIQITLLTLQLLVVLVMSVIIKRLDPHGPPPNQTESTSNNLSDATLRLPCGHRHLLYLYDD